MTSNPDLTWFRIGPLDLLEIGRVTTVTAGHHTIALTRTEKGYGAINNKCAHQGGPLGDGFLQNGFVVCPWHAYEYDPLTGEVPGDFDDPPVACYPVEERADGLYIGVIEPAHEPSLMDQMVETMTDWGVNTVFAWSGTQI